MFIAVNLVFLKAFHGYDCARCILGKLRHNVHMTSTFTPVLNPLLQVHTEKVDSKKKMTTALVLLMCTLTHGCSTKLLQSHACPAADLLTRSHELSSCRTSTLHLCTHPYAHTHAGKHGKQGFDRDTLNLSSAHTLTSHVCMTFLSEPAQYVMLQRTRS